MPVGEEQQKKEKILPKTLDSGIKLSPRWRAGSVLIVPCCHFAKMVLLYYRMRLTFILLVLCAVHANTKRTAKKIEKEIEEIETKRTTDVTTDSTTGRSVTGLPKNAIIAIEVVDPKENTTKEGKGRKRTIESALGYGYSSYQNFFDVKPKPPKYEVYKYSQHDIPPFKGPAKNVPVETYPDTYQGYNTHGSAPSGHAGASGHGGHSGPSATGPTSYSEQESHGGHASTGGTAYQVQKSIQYDLGSTQPVYEPTTPKKGANLQQYYQNGATLFSSLDHNGQLSSLSSQVPTNHGPMVPVIILRVYTNQLGQNSLHANIPAGHPYANLNSIDLQSLLAGYVQNNPHQQGGQYYDASAPQSHPQAEQSYYQAPQGSSHAHYSNQAAQVQVPAHGHGHSSQHQHSHHQHDTGLLTSENYPDDAHTKVIFKKPASTKSRSKHARPRPPQKFKITIPENTYSKVEVQEHTYGGPHDGGQYVQQHVQYAEPQVAHNQQYEQQYYYQQPQQYDQYQHAPAQSGHQSHQSQQEYQSSVQSLVQYQQIPQDAQKHQQQQVQQVEHIQQVQTVKSGKQQVAVQQVATDYVPYRPPQQIPVQHAHAQQDQGTQHYNAKQYVQIATYPSNVDPEQHNQQTQQVHHQQGSAIPADYYQQYLQYEQQARSQSQAQIDASLQAGAQAGHDQQIYQNPTGTEVQYLQRPPEQGTENQDYAIVKHSNDAGRDLHPKLYNYHAHGSPAQQRGTAKKKRERKQRKSRVPLVLAPEVMDTLDKKP